MDENRSPRIVIIGVGGGGNNTVRCLAKKNIPDLNLFCVDTNARALSTVEGAKVIRIGGKLTGGFGAGGNPELGQKAAVECRNDIFDAVNGANMVFVVAGMGGGTGTGATPVVAEIAKEADALVVGVVTTPFSFEGERRMEVAMAGAARLKEHVDNLIIIHNDRLLRLVKQEVTIEEAFARADEAMTQGIMAVAELVNVHAKINLDFACLEAIMHIPGLALMAVGYGTGADGPTNAAQQAIDNPFLDISIAKAKGVLFQVVGGSDLTLGQVNSVGELVSKNVDKQAMIFFGMSIDPDMVGRSRITIIATGIPEGVPATRVLA